MSASNCCGPDCCGDEPVAITVSTMTEEVSVMLGAQESLRAEVRAKYGAAAQRAAEGQQATCACGTACDAKGAEWDPITSNLYEAAETDGILGGVIPDAHKIHRAQHAALNNRRRYCIVLSGTVLRTNLHNPLVFSRRLHHGAAFADIVRKWLFDVYVLARLAGEYRRDGVPVIRRRN